jgi:3,4-dihydroxy 2-butanone 4-phosphate synthase/GTP cyclohydrolase II
MYTKYKKMGHILHVRQPEEIEKLKEELKNK